MRRWIILLLCLSPLWSYAAIEAYQFDTPTQEALYKDLVEELRCLVCQNQNLAGSNAELAQDMRRMTYEKVIAGANKDEVIAFMVDRYGDFVRYRPPFKSSTYLLWIGPFIILAVGLLVLIRFIRRKGREATPEMSPEDLERAEALLNSKKEKQA